MVKKCAIITKRFVLSVFLMVIAIIGTQLKAEEYRNIPVDIDEPTLKQIALITGDTGCILG